jgi:hypothetical protein
MCIGSIRRSSRDLWRVKASRGKFQDSLDLFPSDIVLLDDLVNRSPQFEVFKDCRDGHSGVAEHLRAATPVGHTFHRRALRPIEICHD